MTFAEIILWGYLKNKQLSGLKFRRQQGIGKYIVDFYCPSNKLAIELDGDIHFEKEVLKIDLLKAKYLKETGIKLIRFYNIDILNNIEYVLEKIKSVIQQAF